MSLGLIQFARLAETSMPLPSRAEDGKVEETYAG